MRFARLDWSQQQTGAVESAPENRVEHYSNEYPLERGGDWRQASFDI